MDTVYIHADESCLGNQNKKASRRGGAGGLLEIWRKGEWERRDYWLSEPDTTNNRMAIRSIIEPLGQLKKRCRVVFTSDSKYLVEGIRSWRSGWERRAYKGVKNPDLWKRAFVLVDRHDVEVRWVRGHDGHPENEYADRLATKAAAEQTGSSGFVPSGFTEWLDAEREEGRFLDYMEFEAPAARYGGSEASRR